MTIMILILTLIIMLIINVITALLVGRADRGRAGGRQLAGQLLRL